MDILLCIALWVTALFSGTVINNNNGYENNKVYKIDDNLTLKCQISPFPEKVSLTDASQPDPTYFYSTYPNDLLPNELKTIQLVNSVVSNKKILDAFADVFSPSELEQMALAKNRLCVTFVFDDTGRSHYIIFTFLASEDNLFKLPPETFGALYKALKNIPWHVSDRRLKYNIADFYIPMETVKNRGKISTTP